MTQNVNWRSAIEQHLVGHVRLPAEQPPSESPPVRIARFRDPIVQQFGHCPQITGFVRNRGEADVRSIQPFFRFAFALLSQVLHMLRGGNCCIEIGVQLRELVVEFGQTAVMRHQ